MFARKSGACMDWAVDMCAKNDVKVTLWEGYYKGPTYTEFPVTHFFYNKDVSLDYTYGNSTGIGNVVLVPAMLKEAEKLGVKTFFRMPAVRFVKNAKGEVDTVIAGRKGNYTRFVARRGVVIASGCYASNEEMRKHWSPYSLRVDAQIYFPAKTNTGDCHIMAMQAGGAMQKLEDHAATVHLEAGAASYGFLHVNALGERFVLHEGASAARHRLDRLRRGLDFSGEEPGRRQPRRRPLLRPDVAALGFSSLAKAGGFSHPRSSTSSPATGSRGVEPAARHSKRVSYGILFLHPSVPRRPGLTSNYRP